MRRRTAGALVLATAVACGRSAAAQPLVSSEYESLVRAYAAGAPARETAIATLSSWPEWRLRDTVRAFRLARVEWRLGNPQEARRLFFLGRVREDEGPQLEALRREASR